MKERVRGCLVGQCVGDALGTTYEFMTSKNAIDAIKNNLNDNFLPIVGDGPFKLYPGQPTDDSELALALTRSIIRSKCINLNNIAESMIRWYYSNPFDIGNTTKNAFRNNASCYNDMIRNSHEYNQNSSSNGSLMRISPLGICGLNMSRENLRNIVFDICKLTHPNNVVIDACFVYVVSLVKAIRTGNPRSVYFTALNTSTTPIVKEILMNATHSPYPYLNSQQILNDDSNYMGYFGIALQNAFYELIHFNSFENSLTHIISRGGDTDTNAYISGALLGACYGINSIPTKWIETVLNAKHYQRRSEFPDSKTIDLLELADNLYTL